MFRRIGSSSNKQSKGVEVRVTSNPESTRKSMKKQFPNNFHIRSEIKDAQLLVLFEGGSISHSKLNVQDIEGATPNTNLSQAVKNRMHRYRVTTEEQIHRNTLIREAINERDRGEEYQQYHNYSDKPSLLPKIVIVGKNDMPNLYHSNRCKTLHVDTPQKSSPKKRRLLSKIRVKTQLCDYPGIKYICVPSNLLRNRGPNQL